MSLKVVMAVFPLNDIFFGTRCTISTISTAGQMEAEVDCDCVVVGGGMAGLSAAEELCRAGLRCSVCSDQ